MILPLNLNRRHKVALFFILALAGIAAMSGARMMEVVGILLLGLAFALAFGSDSRVVHWLFLSLGVLLACGTVGLAWFIHQSDTNLYARKVAAFKQRMPELAKEYPLHKEPAGWQPVTPSPQTKSSWNDEAQVAGLDLSKVPFNELPGGPPEPLWGLISDPFSSAMPGVAVWQVVLFGMFLFASGLGLILGIRAKPLPP